VDNTISALRFVKFYVRKRRWIRYGTQWRRFTVWKEGEEVEQEGMVFW